MYEIVNTIICYKNGTEVVDYIESMRFHEWIEKVCFVIVLNEANMEDKSVIDLFVSSTDLNVMVYIPSKNMGYLNGMICGYRYFRQYYEAPNFVIMSNTDISIPDKGYYRLLLEKEYDKDVGCIGPSVFVKMKKTYDNPVAEKRRTLRDVNRIINIFSIPLLGGMYVYLASLKSWILKKSKSTSRYVYEVHGCYFILTQRFAEILKQKEYGTFMYSEEAYIAELIFHNNMRSYYDSDLEVIHSEHSTTKFVKSTKIAQYINESMKYIKTEFYS